MSLNKPPKVEITWTDSTTYGGWMKLSDAIEHEPADCVTAGYLIEKNDKFVIVAQNLSDAESDVGELIVIPCGCIGELREL